MRVDAGDPVFAVVLVQSGQHRGCDVVGGSFGDAGDFVGDGMVGCRKLRDRGRRAGFRMLLEPFGTGQADRCRLPHPRRVDPGFVASQGLPVR